MSQVRASIYSVGSMHLTNCNLFKEQKEEKDIYETDRQTYIMEESFRAFVAMTCDIAKITPVSVSSKSQALSLALHFLLLLSYLRTLLNSSFTDSAM